MVTNNQLNINKLLHNNSISKSRNNNNHLQYYKPLELYKIQQAIYNKINNLELRQSSYKDNQFNLITKINIWLKWDHRLKPK